MRKSPVSLFPCQMICIVVSVPDDLHRVQQGHETVIFDDFNFSRYSKNELKRMFDWDIAAVSVDARNYSVTLYRHQARIVLCNEVPEVRRHNMTIVVSRI